MFTLVLALGVAAVLVLLGARPVAASQRCTAVLPGGGAHVLDSGQADNAALIAAVAGSRGMPARAVTIALATALQESKLTNIDYGDRDSLGIFQQRPSQGWGTEAEILDAVYATNAFFDALQKVPDYEDLAITVAAQAVQRSAYPEAYARHESRARAFASALAGHSPAALTCDLDPLAEPSASLAENLTARLTRDWGAAPVTVDDAAGRAVVDATAVLPGIPAATAAWSVGQWAVATASSTEVSWVAVGDRVWERGEDGWNDAGDRAQPAGVILVG
ncbi:MAG: hypothetical protein LPK92_11480 [Actinomycetes bacterium]|nr:hypothetical protein [Actinomycetes bacterium]